MNPTDSAAPPAPRTPQPRPGLPITANPTVKRERRLGVAAACALAAVLCALSVVWFFNQATDRTQVLAVARNVPAGQTLTADDLTMAEVSTDSALTPIPASDRSSVLGDRTAVPLRKGSLLTRSQLAHGTGLGDSKQQVGVKVERGRAPAGALVPGDEVLAVTTPAEGDQPTGQDETEQTTPISATVVSVTKPDASGTVVVNLAVASTDGPVLAKRAASGRIALVREPRSS